MSGCGAISSGRVCSTILRRVCAVHHLSHTRVLPMQAAGYNTYLVGQFLNGFNRSVLQQYGCPQGWTAADVLVQADESSDGGSADGAGSGDGSGQDVSGGGGIILMAAVKQGRLGVGRRNESSRWRLTSHIIHMFTSLEVHLPHHLGTP